jgi:peptidyl-tRNA hydrolase, PTH1 family
VHLVVGLGNPGKKYEKNRHNVGFMVIDRLRESHGLPDLKEKFSGIWAKGDLILSGGARKPIAVLEPQTFMNLSGDSVQPASAFLKVEPANVIVVHDELDVPWRDVRLKLGGGHAGHNGLRSIIGRLGADFVRVRVGVGRPPADWKGDVADFVLNDFTASERSDLPSVIDRACAAIERVVAEGTSAAMNAINAPPAIIPAPKK